MLNRYVTRGLVFVLCLTLAPVLSIGQSDQKDGSGNTDGSSQKEKSAEPEEKGESDHRFSVADGHLNFVAPKAWKKIKPKFAFFHAEFKIPKVEGDEKDGRVTFSQVGGTIEQNLERWVGQFKELDTEAGDSVKKATKTIDGMKVQMIQINGTFTAGGGGPMAPKSELEDYVLFGAAVKPEQGEAVYIKAYGPKKTMNANHKALEALLKSMKASDG